MLLCVNVDQLCQVYHVYGSPQGLEAVLYRVSIDISTANLYMKWEEESPLTVIHENREGYAIKLIQVSQISPRFLG